MAFTRKNYAIGAGVLALGAAIGLAYRGLQFDRVTNLQEAKIAGENVTVQVYQNKLISGGVNICFEPNNCVSVDSYKKRLETMVDQAVASAETSESK
ncbi:hypothetical protein HZA98_00790 [Candidatus Woesearchaeota archaeon]|nr:hypothetical protein [Candidatus Woesearchaeota archaeon]